MNCLITYKFTGLEHKSESKSTSNNEMRSLYCTTLGFISKNTEFDPKQNILKWKIFEKNLVLK